MNRTDSSYASQYAASHHSDNGMATAEEVRQRFSSVSYITSIAGILKLIIIVLFVISDIIFLAMGACPSTPDWYPYVYPSCALCAIVVSLVLYVIFLFAIAKSNLKFWATTDVIVSLLAAVAVVVSAVLSITTCTSGDSIYQLAASLGLVGALLLAANAASTYIMAKYQEEDLDDEFEVKSKARRFIRRFTLEASNL